MRRATGVEEATLGLSPLEGLFRFPSCFRALGDGGRETITLETRQFLKIKYFESDKFDLTTICCPSTDAWK